jgi:hypothetical protein
VPTGIGERVGGMPPLGHIEFPVQRILVVAPRAKLPTHFVAREGAVPVEMCGQLGFCQSTVHQAIKRFFQTGG